MTANTGEQHAAQQTTNMLLRKHCNSYGSDIWQVCVVTDVPLNKAVGIA